MGKTGKLYSSTVVCSPTSFTQDTSNSFVVHGSGLSVDVAAAAVQRLLSNRWSSNKSGTSLDVLLPVTVESISPPSSSKMKLLVENHSSRTRLCNYKCDSLIQMELWYVIKVLSNMVALVAGMFPAHGCYFWHDNWHGNSTTCTI